MPNFPLHCRQEKIDFWDNVYGFDMSSIKQRALIEPLVDSVDPDQIATSSCQMKAINILDMKVSDAEFEVSALLLSLCSCMFTVGAYKLQCVVNLQTSASAVTVVFGTYS